MKHCRDTSRRLLLMGMVGLLPLAPALAQDRPASPAPAAPAAPSPTAASERNIRFQFDGIPYADVLERFAQMAKKPLVADTNIVGTLTFNDPNPYTYEEALDTFNLMLSMKGLMLIEAGHYLRLVPFKELPAMPLPILRGLDRTGDVRPGEVVTVVLEVKNIDAKEIADSITSMLSNAGSVASLSRGRGLIVTDRLSNIQRIRTLLSTIDTESVVDRQMKTYTLLNASGAIVSDLLNRTFGLATAPKRTTYNPNSKVMEVLPPDPNDYVTSVYDDASRTLVLFGPRERIGLAEELINKFEQKDGPGGDVRIYYPQSLRSDELASMLRQAVPGIAAPGESAGSAATKARLITDTNQNRLIVAAPIPGQLEQIEQLINRVDKPVHGQTAAGPVPLRSQTVQLTKVFRPRASEATNLAQILTQALTRRSPSGQPSTTASVSFEPGSQSVVLSGSPTDIQIATDIVTQLETGTSQPTQLQTRFIDVGTPAEAKRLQPLVEQLYKNEVSDGSLGAVAHAKILADFESGRLIVTASESHLTRIDEIVRQLRSDRPELQPRRLQILSLKNVRADAALPNLQSLIADRMSEKRFVNIPKPSILTDGSNNRLLVTGTDDQLREIEQILGVVDVVPDKPRRDLAVLQLEFKSAAEIIPLVTQLSGQLTEDPSQPPPALMADPTGKQLIVLASAKDLERVRTLVKQFDTTTASAAPRQFKGIDLINRTAAELTPLVQQLYQEQLKGQPEPPGGLASVMSEPKKNRIMVSGPEKEIARVEGIVRQLDPEGRRAAKEETRVLRLRSGSAADLAGIVEKSLNVQQEEVRVMVDARSNSLVISGSRESVEAASQIVQQLDSQSTLAPRELRIFELKAAEATSLSPMLNNLFTEMIKDQRGTQYQSPTKIVPDVTANRIVVTGIREEINQVAELVQQLDQAPDQAPGARVFKLTTADATMLAPIVSNAMIRFDTRGQALRRTTVTADEKSNSLIVSGTRTDLQDVASVIEKLDGDTSGRERMLRIFDVKSDDPDALAALTLKVFTAQNPGRNTPALLSITPEPATKRLVVLAPLTMMAQVETVITTLDSKPDQGSRELQSIPLKNATGATELLPKVLQIYGEQSKGKTLKPATLYADSSGSRFMVYGTKEQAAAIRQVVETLETQSPTPRETRTFEVGSAQDVQRLQPLLQQLYRDQWKDRLETDPADAQIIADQKTGRLIVTGKPDHLKQIEVLLQQLGTTKAKPEARDTRVYDLTTASAVELAVTVRTLYLEQAKSRWGVQTPDTLITPDAGGNRLIVVADLAELDSVEEIIKKLDKVSAQSATARVFKLKSAEPDKVAEILTTALVRYDAYGKPQKRATVSVDAKTRTLIVTGDPKELQGVSVIIEQLDTSLGTLAERKMRVMTLKQGRAAEISGKLRQLYNDQVRSQPELSTTEVLILDEPASNQLILAGSDAQLKLVESILNELQSAQANRPPRETQIIEIGTREELNRLLPLAQQLYQDQWKNKDTSDPADATLIADAQNARLIVTARSNHIAEIQTILATLRTPAPHFEFRDTQVFELSTSTSAEVLDTVKSLYQEQLRSRPAPAGGSATILSDAGGNRIVVSGSSNELSVVERIISKLDKGSARNGSIQVYPLKKARAEDLADAVTKSLAARSPQGRAPRVHVTPVSGANSVLIHGPGDAVPEVLNLIRELDSEATEDEIEVRIFKLENGNAREVQTIINQILQNTTRRLRADGTPRASRTSISVDERSNSLIISATPVHFRLIDKVLPTLDKAPERSDRDVQFVWLKKAKAYDVVSKLEAVFSSRPESERPVVEADSINNSLTIIAKRGDVPQVQDLISRLDDTARDSSLQVRLRPLERVAAEQMARMLQNIYPQMTRNPLKVVEKVAPPSAPAPAAGAPAAPQPPATPTSPQVSTTNSVPEVVIAVDKEANALLLSGPAQELDHIERIISDLSYSFYGNEAEFRMFPLKDADPVVVARALNDLLKQEPVAVPGQGGRTVTPTPKITIVPESRTRSIIVRARPTDFALVESIVKQLDTGGQAGQVEFRLIPLTNAPPEKVLPLVQQMVTQLNVSRPGDAATVTVDPRTRGLMVVARDTALAQIERMIRSLDTPSAHVEAEVLVLSLKKANASQLAAVLQNMLKPGAQGELPANARELQEQVRRLKIQNDAGQPVVLDLTHPIRIATDPAGGQGGGNRLVLTSTPDNLKALSAIVASLDTVALVEGVDIKVVALKHADAAAVFQTVSSIFSQGRQLATGPGGPGAQPEGAAGKALINPLTVATDPRSNTLIVTGQKETLDLALKVIADLDQPLQRFITEVKLFRLKHASATRLVPMLQAVFAEGPPVPGSEGLSTLVTRLRTLREAQPAQTTETSKTRAALVVQADELSNILIIAARSDTLPLIGEVIDQLDIPAASGLESVRIYPLNHSDPAALQRILNDLYSGPRAASLRNEDKPIVSVDDRTGSLIVAGNGKSFAMIEALLQQLDQKLAFDLRDIRVLPLQNADAVSVAATLQRLMDARITQRATLNKGQGDLLKVTILADTRSNALLIGGSRDSFELVETLAKQLDTSTPALSGRIRVIPLAQADARVIASTLTTLFEQRYAAGRGAEVQRNKPIILADPRSNSLLITANQEDNGTIDDLLKRLDLKPENPSLTLTVLPLKHNDSARVASMIESIFTARQRAQTLPGQTPLPSEQIKLEPDPLNNALIVSASKENLELIQGLLQRLDAEPVIAGGVLESFTLQFADVQRVAAILRSLVDQGLYRPGLLPGAAAKSGTQRDVLSISVDARSNSMMVSASPENLAIVREVIRRVDTKDFSEATNVRLYPLKNARASSLATTLEKYFLAKRAGDAVAQNASERSIPVSVIADDRMNTLLITGGKEAFDVAERLIQQLDGESVFARMNFKVFPLQRATATKLQATLQQIVSNRPPKVKGEPVDPITIVADSWVNALLVGASVEDMGIVESLIQRLDSEPAEAGLAIHVFSLAKADARRVAQIVQGLFRDGTPGSTLPVSVSADERMNAIVVSCGETDAKRIEALVKKLDTEQIARVSEIKVFPLRYARAESLSSILNTALNTKPVALTEQSPNAQSVLQFITRTEEGKELVTAALKEAILITPDIRMNSLIVSGPVDYMGLIEQIISRLDASSPQQAKIKVFALQNADAHQMAELLMQLFRMSQVPTQPGNQRSIQYTLVRPKFGDPNSPPQEEALASATLGTAEQNALTVTVDPRTNSLLVGGTDHYVGLVSQIIDSLDSTPANERKTEVVKMKNTQAQEVATAIRTFLDQERQRVTQVLGAEAVGTAQRLLEREVAVVAEPVSNTLLISANPRDFDQLRKIIDQLDEPQEQVLIQVLLAEVTLDALTDLGVEWSHNGKKGDVSYGIGTDFSVKDQLTSFGGFSSAVSGSDFSFLLRALKDDGRLEVLSRPQIVTADNKPATINIGQRVPLITDSRVTERGDTINSFRYEDVGVNLSVTPKISPDGFVKMDIGTTNSALSSSSVEINKSAVVPVINQRRANTTVSVQSGQTIIIGGLIATTDDKRVKKMPVLGDIPWLGALFRSTHTSRDRKELLIMLTPQVLSKVREPGKIRTALEITREQLDHSRMKDEIRRDLLQKQLLDPLFPADTNAAPTQPRIPPIHVPRP